MLKSHKIVNVCYEIKQIFDFTLSAIDMAKLRELDQKEFGRTFDFVTAFKG